MRTEKRMPGPSPEGNWRDTDTLRLFVAVDLPDAIRARLVEARKDFPGLRWTPPENMHLTLRFLGETGRQEAVRNALRAAHVAPFSLRLSALGLFERRHHTILWAGLENSAPLSALKRQVDDLLAGALGLERERAFSPHITLCRVRGGLPSGLREQAAGYCFADKSFAVQSFTLFRSVLLPAGASHMCLERYPPAFPAADTA
jgi:2'-5' RNA ligase